MTTVPLLSKLITNNSNVRVLLVYNCLQGLYLGYIQVFWQPFLVGLGVSIALIGILEAVAGAFGILSSLVQSVGGRFSDRAGRKRVILAGSLLLVLCWSAGTVAFAVKLQWLVIPAYLLWSLGALSLPVLDAILADSVVPTDRSRVYSLIMIAQLLPGALTGYLAGEYSQSLGAVPFLALAGALEAGGLGLLLWRLHNVGSPLRVEALGLPLRKRMAETLANMRTHWKYFSVISMDSLVWSLGSSLLYGLLQQSQGFTKMDFGLIAVTIPIGVVVGTVPGGWLTHRIGPRKLLILSEFFGAAMIFGWGLYPLPQLAPVYGFVWGAAISTWVPVQFHLSAELFPQKNRGELMGNLGTVRGLIRAVGPVLAVLLFLSFGYSAPMLGGGVGMLLTIVLIAKFIPSRSSI